MPATTQPNSPNTLLELLDRGAQDRVAIQVPDGPGITYESLRRQVRSLAAALRAAGVGQQDRVGIVLPNSAETIVTFLGVAAAATAAPLNPAYKADEFRFYMEDTNARALITGPEGAEAALEAAEASTILFSASMDASGEIRLVGPSVAAANGPAPAPGPGDVALVLHTSGTTSRPKRVPLAHARLVASVRNIVETYHLTPDDVSLCIMPLFHVHGLVASTLATLASGGTVVVPPRFNALNLWRTVREQGVTWFTAVPTMHQALVARARSAGDGNREGVGSPALRFIRSCSAPLPAATMLEMEERFGVPVLEAYGMTEAAHQMSSNPMPPGDRRPGSVGRGTGVTIAIMDEEGTLQPTGTRGEVVIRGNNVIDAYENNPDANASSFTNGYFRTGDEGALDADGYLTLLGRLKEIINRSGEKISPQEIDEVLLSHPAVAEAVAFGIPHATHGEEPSAAVVLKADALASDLVKYCREHMADFKCPRVIHIMEQIPRTATGKVQRRIVAEAVLSQQA